MPSASMTTAAKPDFLRAFATGTLNPRSLFLLHDPAIAQLDDAFAVGGILLGVRDLHNCHSLLVQLTEELHDFLALTGVQVPCRFIGKQKLWLGDDRACN